MYWRIWWKEARQFWPIWAFLVGAAAAVQALMLSLGGIEIRHGYLPAQAMAWAWLYGMAAGAAAFAGERENGTLKWLDALAAPRGAVWRAKVAFAIVTTLGLMVVLLLMAAPWTSSINLGGNDGAGYFWAAPMIGVGMLSLAFGFLCSALMASAIAAAVSAIALTSIGWVLSAAWVDHIIQRPYDLAPLVFAQAFLALAVLALSYIAFLWPRRARHGHVLSRRNRPWPSVRLQSPIVVDRTTRELAASSTADTPAQIAPSAPRAIPYAFGASAPWPAPVSPAGAIGPAATAWPRSRWAETRHLVWQTVAQGRSTWFLLLLISVALPLLQMFYGLRSSDAFASWSALSIVMLTAGTAVFHLEQRGHGQRFLAHHGARPGMVWLTKMLTWCFGLFVVLAIVAATAFLMSLRYPYGWGLPRSGDPRDSWAAVLALPLFFAVAQFCGMVVPRGITAWAIAMVLGGFLALAMAVLSVYGLMSFWAFAVVSLALLAATWLWSGDWLFPGRPAPGRYGRLALIVAGLSSVLVAGYTGSRAWGLADPGPIVPPRAWADAAGRALGAPDNAAPLYREAARLVGADHDEQILDLLRQAAKKPFCQFFNPQTTNLTNHPGTINFWALTDVMANHAQERLKANDLSGAWDGIVLMFRTARHFEEGSTRALLGHANQFEDRALNLAIDWALAPGQSAEALRWALGRYRALPAPIAPAEIVRGEGLLLEHTLDLPSDDLRMLLLDLFGRRSARPNREVSLASSLYAGAISTPWEVARARRALRRYVAEQAPLAEADAYQRRPERQERRGQYSAMSSSSPLMRTLAPARLYSDDPRAKRRGLEQLLAVREWQARHQGNFPRSLAELVPDTFSKLPLDPYSGRPFGYILLDEADDGIIQIARTPIFRKRAGELPTGTRLLYSVGPNGQDDVRRNGPARFSPYPRYHIGTDDPMRRFAEYGVDDLVIIIPPTKRLEK